MNIQSLVVGPVAANCYILSDAAGEGIVIDPGGDAPTILEAIKKENLKINAVLNTHGHSDHIGANDAVRDATGAPLYIHAADENMLTDPLSVHGQQNCITTGRISLEGRRYSSLW